MTVDSRYYSLVVVLRSDNSISNVGTLSRRFAVCVIKPLRSADDTVDTPLQRPRDCQRHIGGYRPAGQAVDDVSSLFGGVKPWHVLRGVCLHAKSAKQSWLASIPWCHGWDRSRLVLTGHCLVEITPFRWLSQTKTNGRHYHLISQEGGSRWGRVVSLAIGLTVRLCLACPHRYKTKTHTHTHTHTHTPPLFVALAILDRVHQTILMSDPETGQNSLARSLHFVAS